MKNKPPTPLLLFATLCLITDLLVLIIGLSGIVAIRLLLSVILFFFVLRGYRSAGNLLAVLCVPTALGFFAAAAGLKIKDPISAALLALLGILTAAFAVYVIASRSVRTFQQAQAQSRLETQSE